MKELLFDRHVVGKMKESGLTKDALYNHLCNGRITLQEYLLASKSMK